LMGATKVWLLLAALILLAAGGCANAPKTQEMDRTVSDGLPPLIPADSTCVPTDQDQYVWRPARLQLLHPCVRAAGIVMELDATEPDGDLHMHLQLDPAFQALLTVGNQKGYLIVEAICQTTPVLIEALRICASDPDPYPGPLPDIGDHVWVEGRYVLDLGHNSQAELHPLYRWGLITP
jgi:hypothetical protein